ncbi:hypothetical protein ACFVWX_13520 [Streptomyces sp. NPDC058220]|uniref:hypothetical protein n=1 Tax=Streptomyces sp. NPDC058220 TaxID=3346387 RepID=UPI0036EFC802
MPDATPAVPCSLAVLSRPHAGHEWEIQPGMTPVHCPGVPDDMRRARYAAALAPNALNVNAAADAAMAVADKEQRDLRAELEQDAAITKEVMDRADEDMEGARATARYFKALAEQAQAWGEQHRDRANRYRTRTDVVRAECAAIVAEATGSESIALMGRKHAATRIRAALQTISHDTPVLDDPRVTALESEITRLRAELEQAQTATQPGPVSEDGAQQ